MTQSKTNVVFSSDYYPYGLAYNRFERTAQELRNKYGYQGKEYLDEEGLDTYDFHARYYDPAFGRFTSVDPKAAQFASMSSYLGMGANPTVIVDPDGRFITWSVGSGGVSIGINLTPIGIPLGAGLSVGWGDGFSAGPYGEVGYRVGGDGLGAGAAVQQSLSVNFSDGNVGTSTTALAYGSFGPFTIGGSVSANYDITDNHWSTSWGINAGIGVGYGSNGSSIGFGVGYGSGGFHYGLSGNIFNSKSLSRSLARQFTRRENRHYDRLGKKLLDPQYLLANCPDCNPWTAYWDAAGKWWDAFFAGANLRKTLKDADKMGKQTNYVKTDAPFVENPGKQHLLDWGNGQPEISNNKWNIFQEYYAPSPGDSSYIFINGVPHVGVSVYRGPFRGGVSKNGARPFRNKADSIKYDVN